MPSEREPWKTIKNGSVEVVIYKESAGFRIVWYFAGKRERKFKKDEARAVSFAKKQAASLGSAQPKNASEIEDKMRYYQQLEESMGGVPLHVAVDYWKQNHKRQQLIPERLEVLFADYLERLREDGKSPSYIAAIDGYVRPYVEKFPGKITEQASKEIDHWMRKRTESLHSRKHFLQYLRTLFNWSRDVKKALPIGETEADLVELAKPKPGEIEIYTPEEMRLLLAHAKTDAEIALLVLGGFVGLRNSEITGDRTAHGPLQVSDILFKDAAVRVVQKVQRKSVTRYAPIPDNALTWLDSLSATAGAVVSFRNASLALREIIRRANEAGGEIKFKRNGLRRSHISYRTALTRDPARVGDECNTSPAKIRANYRRPGLESIAHQWYAISKITALPAPPGPPPSIDDATPEAQNAGK